MLTSHYCSTRRALFLDRGTWYLGNFGNYALYPEDIRVIATTMGWFFSGISEGKRGGMF